MSLLLPEQPSRNRSASTGDSGLPKHEHKRPRLSEGHEEEATVSRAPSLNHQPSTDPPSLSSSTNADRTASSSTTPPQSPLPATATSASGSPHNKVTINTRPISSQSSAVTGQNTGVDDSMKSNKDGHSQMTQATQHATHGDRDDAISISSDEYGSPPPIQIAEPEDLDQDPADTTWEPVSSTKALVPAILTQDHVRRTFPFVDNTKKNNAQAVVTNIVNVLAEGSTMDDEVFQKVKHWVVDFAENAADLDYSFFLQEREFWLRFPGLVSGLLRRSIEPPAGLQMQDLLDYFVAYLDICTIVVRADLRNYRSFPDAVDPKAIPKPICPGFLSQLRFMLNPDGIPFYEVLRTTSDCDPKFIVELIIDHLITEVDRHMNLFMNLFETIAGLFSKCVSLIDPGLNIIACAREYLQPVMQQLISRYPEPDERLSQLPKLHNQCTDFIASIDVLLDRAISKQQTWLNIENCDIALKQLGALVNVFCLTFPRIGNDLMLASSIEIHEFSTEQVSGLASTAWRFTALLKLIKKGRMEVRVACIQGMAAELVETYQKFIGHTSRNFDHPQVKFMIQFLRENHVIRYIIGVDSHPQIINRCGSIIGFLCVSNSYQDEDTDIFWQTVLGSQDPRAVVEVLQIFSSNFDNLEISALCHIANKLLALPFERFDLPMLEFALQLFHSVNFKRTQSDVPDNEASIVDEATIRFCLRLLREANTPAHICADVSARMRAQIATLLIEKVRLMGGQSKLESESGPLHSLLNKQCEDLRSHNEFACGSAAGFAAILKGAKAQEALELIQLHHITPILAEDILHTCKETVSSQLHDATYAEFDIKINLLTTLAFLAPESFSKSIIEILWVDVFASNQLDEQIRSMFWSSFGNIFDSCKVRNPVLESIIEDHLTSLESSLYNPAVLYFAQQSVKYETLHSPVELMTEENMVAIPGIERVWSIMLQAPPNSVELLASQFIIEQYLDSEQVLRRDALSIETTHTALIDRCVQDVIDAASYLKSFGNVPMKEDLLESSSRTSSIDRDVHSMRFHRSLLFLRRFLENVKQRPRYAPAVNENLKKALNTFEKTGQLFEVSLQIIGHKVLANIQTKWSLGYDNQGTEVWKFLSEITGWSQFIVINGGKRVVLQNEQSTLRELGVKPGSLMINKVIGSAENAPTRSMRATSPVDNKVMHHFEELYSLLDLKDEYAKEVYDFLRMFSSQEGVLQKLKSRTLLHDQLLPVDRPFKLMYYARALRSCIEDESYSSEPNVEFLVYGIQVILATLPNLGSLKADLQICLASSQELIEALILAFRARVPSEISKSYILNGRGFAENLLALWSRSLSLSQTDVTAPDIAVLVQTPFEALVEGLLHDEGVWATVPQDALIDRLQKSILEHPIREVRQATSSVIYGITGFAGQKIVAKANESRTARNRFPATTISKCLGQLWSSLLPIVQQADFHARTCEDLFDALTAVLREHRHKLTDTELGIEINKWKLSILEHKHKHVIGQAPQDMFLSSISKLLLQAIKTVQISDALGNGSSFIQDLFVKFLFPPCNRLESSIYGMESPLRKVEDPILDMNTRWSLYDLILTICNQKDHVDTVCDVMLGDMIPKTYHFPPNSNNERQCLRSETGYSGLRNLSNTCYLNSLLSQLFMNVEFRELIMNVNIIDKTKQRLVYELGKVFAHMQNSYEESVNPEPAIDAITLWDGDQIDVAVQMDVDEFYNLLFDRLESQIVDPKVCNAFKNIYGGELVQQIKSRECEHVSERIEPFAAVQVEIKGKASLEESLKAYVEGEVLQGENKYSCTGCGKHVDAVKRACLKTVPDHLIFNLKRFDYDIMTGTRCKVNDEFGFPNGIDIAPYTLDALSDVDKSVDPDMFELVGVIIHSGTAESGHYYSYIRQRPSNRPAEMSWLQFNDHDVGQFDPSIMRECCFGGMDFGTIQCSKFYNGYMLFYQRRSSIEDFETRYTSQSTTNTICLPTSEDLTRQISLQNELSLRSYVSQDPTHSRFVKRLLQQKQLIEELRCPQKHDSTTTKLLNLALDHINQLSARWKDLPDVEDTILSLRVLTSECDFCAQDILQWLMKDDNLVNNLLRSCYPVVRRAFMTLTVACWTKWNETIHLNTSVTGRQDYHTELTRYLSVMANGWDHLQRYGRGWEHYFTVLTLLLRMGQQEAQAVIQAGFLELALELAHVPPASSSPFKQLQVKYQAYITLRNRNRPYGHAYLVQFLADILQQVSFQIPVSDNHTRIAQNDGVGLNSHEALLLEITTGSSSFSWFNRIAVERSNAQAICRIVERLCETRQFDVILGSTLRDGLNDHNVITATAFLQPTLVFAAFCASVDTVVEIIEDALEAISTTNGTCAKDFVKFVHSLLSISNTEAGIEQGGLKHCVKRLINSWAPIMLTSPNDADSEPRSDALDLVNTILLQDMNENRISNPRAYNQAKASCRALTKACAKHVKHSFLDDRANIQAGQANQICRLVDHCIRFFGDNASDEDTITSVTTVMDEFKARSDGVVETVTEADWNASSDWEGMSEVDVSEASN